MKQIIIKKGQIIQHSGELATKIYNVKSGLLRSYSIDEKGKEHIFMFAPAGWTRGGANALKVTKELLPHFGGNVIAEFSLPQFYKKFSPNGLSDSVLKEDLVQKIRLFQEAI